MKYIIFKSLLPLVQFVGILCFDVPVVGDEWMEGLDKIMDEQLVQQSESRFLYLFHSDDDLIVDFMLYTREKSREPVILREGNVTLKKLPSFNSSLDMKIIVHGWRNGFDSPIGDMLKQVYLDKYDVNVIVVDWSSRSYRNYASSRLSVPNVADALASMIDGLVKERGVSPSRIHVIGHSLGAHIAGIAGLRLPYKIARVTGLDPAAPMFSMVEEDILKPASADFVDVIHTCGYMLGLIAPLGHADFYPNKGTPPQPGCGFDLTGECSHSRAYELFAESIGSNEFLAVQCEDSAAFDRLNCTLPAIIMGEHLSTQARGLYYLNTKDNLPFATGLSPLNSRPNRGWLWF